MRETVIETDSKKNTMRKISYMIPTEQKVEITEINTKITTVTEQTTRKHMKRIATNGANIMHHGRVLVIVNVRKWENVSDNVQGINLANVRKAVQDKKCVIDRTTDHLIKYEIEKENVNVNVNVSDNDNDNGKENESDNERDNENGININNVSDHIRMVDKSQVKRSIKRSHESITEDLIEVLTVSVTDNATVIDNVIDRVITVTSVVIVNWIIQRIVSVLQQYLDRPIKAKSHRLDKKTT
jgi:hypothetical protein